MSFTVAAIVQEARELLLDETAPFRYSDAYIVTRRTKCCVGWSSFVLTCSHT